MNYVQSVFEGHPMGRKCWALWACEQAKHNVIKTIVTFCPRLCILMGLLFLSMSNPIKIPWRIGKNITVTITILFISFHEDKM